MANGTAQVGTRIEEAIAVLFRPGQLVEVRGKKIGGGIASKYYYDHEHLAEVIAKADASEKI
jgi:hypothetical protein